MDRDQATGMSCGVCGIETKRHAGWFLVMENCWLDRVKVLSWNPVLAREGRIRAVCGKVHLKIMLTHWLNCANLQLMAGGTAPLPADMNVARSRYASFSAGRVLGELAVEREWLSPVWTGSPETMECILDALIGETDAQSQALKVTSLENLVGYSRDYAFR
ncbi:MAG: hypothetical protein HY010_02230 [Acidobacteria bacterium]|nr:hypothetical protein [Acidobacteriota bacterium]